LGRVSELLCWLVGPPPSKKIFFAVWYLQILWGGLFRYWLKTTVIRDAVQSDIHILWAFTQQTGSVMCPQQRSIFLKQVCVPLECMFSCFRPKFDFLEVQIWA